MLPNFEGIKLGPNQCAAFPVEEKTYAQVEQCLDNAAPVEIFSRLQATFSVNTLQETLFAYLGLLITLTVSIRFSAETRTCNAHANCCPRFGHDQNDGISSIALTNGSETRSQGALDHDRSDETSLDGISNELNHDGRDTGEYPPQDNASDTCSTEASPPSQQSSENSADFFSVDLNSGNNSGQEHSGYFELDDPTNAEATERACTPS